MAFKLPNSIGGKRDLIMTLRQIEQIVNDRLQDDVRERFGAKRVGTKAGQRMVNELLELNKLKDDTESLKTVQKELEQIKENAGQLRISFSQEPDQDMYQQIVKWFRTEIDPGVLVQIGVQPAIGAGFILKTPMRRYDFSVKTKIMSSTPKFVEVLHRTTTPGEPVA